MGDQISAIVKHTPTNSNFWHFSIIWVLKDGTEINSNSAKWKNIVIATIRAKLQEAFILSTPELKLISEKDYFKHRFSRTE